jgi:hypothetical protein
LGSEVVFCCFKIHSTTKGKDNEQTEDEELHPVIIKYRHGNDNFLLATAISINLISRIIFLQFKK